ncbi:MAG TPA: hypothetical protein VH682_31525 [Gemmataceae bacterium]
MFPLPSWFISHPDVELEAFTGIIGLDGQQDRRHLHPPIQQVALQPVGGHLADYLAFLPRRGQAGTLAYNAAKSP